MHFLCVLAVVNFRNCILALLVQIQRLTTSECIHIPQSRRNVWFQPGEFECDEEHEKYYACDGAITPPLHYENMHAQSIVYDWIFGKA